MSPKLEGKNGRARIRTKVYSMLEYEFIILDKSPKNEVDLGMRWGFVR